MLNDVEIIDKSQGYSTASMLYIDGISMPVFGNTSEFDVQKRKGWIERTVRSTDDHSINNIEECTKTSQFWLNYISLGTRYPEIISKLTYREWDKDRCKTNADVENQKKSKKNKKRHITTQNAENNTKK